MDLHTANCELDSTASLTVRHRGCAGLSFARAGARLDGQETNRIHSLFAFDVRIVPIRLVSSFSSRQPRLRAFAARESMGNDLCPHGLRVAHRGGDWSLRRRPFPLDR